MLDHRKLAVIHIVKKELALTDEAYREILAKVTGTRSAKELDERQFRKLMHFFTRSEHYRLNENGLTFRQKLYIEHLKNELGWGQDHFINFLKKYYKKTDILTFNRKEASKVIESLKHILAAKDHSPSFPQNNKEQ